MNTEQLRRTSSLFVYCNFLALLSTTICSQTINKQFVNIADESLTDYSFLSWYHYTKTKNYLKRRYRIRHWIPMFIGTPCRSMALIKLCKTNFWNQNEPTNYLFKPCVFPYTGWPTMDKFLMNKLRVQLSLKSRPLWVTP